MDFVVRNATADSPRDWGCRHCLTDWSVNRAVQPPPPPAGRGRARSDAPSHRCCGWALLEDGGEFRPRRNTALVGLSTHRNGSLVDSLVGDGADWKYPLQLVRFRNGIIKNPETYGNGLCR